MSWWRCCSAVIPARLLLESCPFHPGLGKAQGQPQSDFKRDKSSIRRFTQGKYQQVSPVFPLLPQKLNMCTLFPCQREGKMVWAQKWLKSLGDGHGHAASPELAPSCTHSPCHTGGHSWAPSGAQRCEESMSPSPKPPLFLQSPRLWDDFWDESSAGRREQRSWPPREGAFAGILIRAGLLG